MSALNLHTWQPRICRDYPNAGFGTYGFLTLCPCVVIHITIICCLNLFFLYLDAFSKTLEHYKGLDIVCNNAGIGDEIEWQKTVEVDLVSIISITGNG